MIVTCLKQDRDMISNVLVGINTARKFFKETRITVTIGIYFIEEQKYTKRRRVDDFYT